MNSTKDSLSPCARLFIDLLLNEKGDSASSESQTLFHPDKCSAVNGRRPLQHRGSTDGAREPDPSFRLSEN